MTATHLIIIGVGGLAVLAIMALQAILWRRTPTLDIEDAPEVEADRRVTTIQKGDTFFCL